MLIYLLLWWCAVERVYTELREYVQFRLRCFKHHEYNVMISVCLLTIIIGILIVCCACGYRSKKPSYTQTIEQVSMC